MSIKLRGIKCPAKPDFLVPGPFEDPINPHRVVSLAWGSRGRTLSIYNALGDKQPLQLRVDLQELPFLRQRPVLVGFQADTLLSIFR